MKLQYFEPKEILKTVDEKPQFCSKIMKRPSFDDHVDKNLLLMMWMKLAEIQLGPPS